MPGAPGEAVDRRAWAAYHRTILPRRISVLVALLPLVGCSADPTDLSVDLRTDWAPGREFTSVRVRVEPPDGAPAIEPARFAVVGGVGASERYFRGVRVAEVAGVPASFALRTTLFDADGMVVAERVMRVRAAADLAVTVVITQRTCAGCPTTGGDPRATECVDGRCCRVDEDTCSTCTADGECPPTLASCVTPRCVSGVCLSEPTDARCRAGETCDVDLGCVAGVTPDGGRDAAVDASSDGSIDASSDAGTACTPAGCDDGVACTVESCDALGECVSAPDSSRCTAGPGGRCDLATDCQYTTCTPTTCAAGPCEMATCMGTTCVRMDLCTAGQSCCAGGCVPVGCDDGVACTGDSCGVGGCEHLPIDALCTAGPSGRCNPTTGCQYSLCTPATCMPGPCESATCVGDMCSRTSTCTIGQECCAGLCVAVGCDDGNDCTNDSCGATACEHPRLARFTSCADDGDECTQDFCSAGMCTHPVRSDGAVCCFGSATCTTMSMCCGGTCTDATTLSVCGACGVDCVARYGARIDACVGGTCVCAGDGVLCRTGQICCAGAGGVTRCNDPTSSSRHCGGCGIACGTGETCSSSRCCCGATTCGTPAGGPVCPVGRTCTGGACV